MGCRIPESKRKLVTVKIALNCPTKTITKDTNVSTRAVQVFRKNLLEYGALHPPKLVPQGRPHSISPQMEEVSILHLSKRLITSRSLIYFAHVLLCILMNKFIIFGMSLVSRLVNNSSNVY